MHTLAWPQPQTCGQKSISASIFKDFWKQPFFHKKSNQQGYQFQPLWLEQSPIGEVLSKSSENTAFLTKSFF